MHPSTPLNASIIEEIHDPKTAAIIQDFYKSYTEAIETCGGSKAEAHRLFYQLVQLVKEEFKHPYTFALFHQAVRKPFDYHQFGLDFIRPLIQFSRSTVLGWQHVQHIVEQLERKENVILLANHQTEPDPQIISLMLEKRYPALTAHMIFVAGHRVITDPLAIPMSMGCNLLCIYSKKYIDQPPEEKAKKVLHNQRTMKKMSDLLSQGGQCIYVAPSGGRDRMNAQGRIEIAPFDAQSIEMFYLMAQYAEKPTHFYPLALDTYALLPPPQKVEKELGERRSASCTPVSLSFGPEIDMEHFPGSENTDKKSKRTKRAEYIYTSVRTSYQELVAKKTTSS